MWGFIAEVLQLNGVPKVNQNIFTRTPMLSLSHIFYLHILILIIIVIFLDFRVTMNMWKCFSVKGTDFCFLFCFIIYTPYLQYTKISYVPKNMLFLCNNNMYIYIQGIWTKNVKDTELLNKMLDLLLLTHFSDFLFFVYTLLHCFNHNNLEAKDNKKKTQNLTNSQFFVFTTFPHCAFSHNLKWYRRVQKVLAESNKNNIDVIEKKCFYFLYWLQVECKSNNGILVVMLLYLVCSLILFYNASKTYFFNKKINWKLQIVYYKEILQFWFLLENVFQDCFIPFNRVY